MIIYLYFVYDVIHLPIASSYVRARVCTVRAFVCVCTRAHIHMRYIYTCVCVCERVRVCVCMCL
jgi:hypothetical protein